MPGTSAACWPARRGARRSPGAGGAPVS